MKARCLLLALLLACSTRFAARGADSQPHPLPLTVGKGELLHFDTDVSKVVIAEPKIADAIIVSPRDVMVNAKGAGQTTLIIWEGDTDPARYDIAVRSDTTELDTMQKALAADLSAALPDTAVEFRGNTETIVLTGKVASAEQSRRAEAI